MKLLVEPSQRENLFLSSKVGLILPLEGYSVESVCYFSLEEIINISKQHNGDIFVKLNRNFFNSEIDSLRDILVELEKLSIAGVFFYDLAVLELKKELHLKLPLVWNQTHMVNNYRTCNYYYDKGVEYALLGKEITLEEILEILEKSSISSMVEVVSRPSVAFSKRKLLTHYYQDLEKNKKNMLQIKEKTTGDFYDVFENEFGTSFYLDTITNGTSIIRDLFQHHCPYIIMREFGVEDFSSLVEDTISYIDGGCEDSLYVEKYKKLGDHTNFFFKKTIYKVK